MSSNTDREVDEQFVPGAVEAEGQDRGDSDADSDFSYEEDYSDEAFSEDEEDGHYEFENAEEYTTQNGRVAIRSSATGGGAVLVGPSNAKKSKPDPAWTLNLTGGLNRATATFDDSQKQSHAPTHLPLGVNSWRTLNGEITRENQDLILRVDTSRVTGQNRKNVLVSARNSRITFTLEVTWMDGNKEKKPDFSAIFEGRIPRGTVIIRSTLATQNTEVRMTFSDDGLITGRITRNQEARTFVSCPDRTQELGSSTMTVRLEQEG